MAVSWDEMTTKKKSVSATPTNTTTAWDAMKDPTADKNAVRTQLSTPKANPIIGKTVTAADLKKLVTPPTQSTPQSNKPATSTPLFTALSTNKTAGVKTNVGTNYKPIALPRTGLGVGFVPDKIPLTGATYENTSKNTPTYNTDTTLAMAPINTNKETQDTAQYIAGRGALGAVKMAKGLVNEVGYLGQGAAQGAYAVAASQNKLADAGKGTVSPITQSMSDSAKKLAETPLTNLVNFGQGFEQNINAQAVEKGYDKDKTLQTIGAVAEGVGGMVPAVISNFIIPGSSLFVMATGAAGNATEEATKRGADTGSALAYGVAVGITEAATEKLFNGVAGIFGKGAADDVIKAVAEWASKDETTQKAVMALANVLGEGFEEWLTEYAEAYENKLLINQDSRTFGQISSDALYSAAIGSLVSVVMQGGDVSMLNAKTAGEQAADDTTAQISSDNVSNTAQTGENNVQVVPNNVQNQGQNVQKPIDNQTNVATPIVPNVNTIAPNLQMATPQQAVQAPVSDFKPQVATDTAKAVEADTSEQAKPESNVAYHFGDLGKADHLSMMDSRGTGHYGTGTYFFGSEDVPGYSDYANKGRPKHVVSFDGYNLYKPQNSTDGRALHDTLKNINDVSLSSVSPDVLNAVLDGTINEQTISDLAYKKFPITVDMDFGSEVSDSQLEKYANLSPIGMLRAIEKDASSRRVSDNAKERARNIDEYTEKATSIVEKISDAKQELMRRFSMSSEKASDMLRSLVKYGNEGVASKSKGDSPSTALMKKLGYDGVDVRGIKGLDNSEFGSVIYDVKKKPNSLFPSTSLGAKITKGMPQGTGAVEAGFDKLGALVNKYGAIPEGENPHSTERVTEERIPKQTADDDKVSQTVRTAYEAPLTTNETADVIEQATLKDLFSYEVATDKAALEKADATIRDKGWDTALKDWTSEVRSGKVSKDLSALGWTMYNNAANSGNAKQAVEILTDLVSMQRSGAQATQAVRLLKKMSPEYQLYAVQRSVQNFQDELNAKYGDMAPNLQIDDTLAKDYLDAVKAKDELAAKQAMIRIYKQVASQVPSTFSDKWNAWRYTAMLFNPVTHIKNVIGNYAFKGERAVKNALSAIAQTTAKKLGADFEQTRVFALTKKDTPLIKACYDDYAKISDEIYKVGKYDDVKNKIADYRTIFGRGGKTAVGNALSKTLGVGVEKARKFNTEALDTEDMWVSRPAYVKALAGYLKANNATLNTANSKLLDRARGFAILEAQKAAYRDSNAFSDWVSTVGRGHAKSVAAKGMKVMTEGVLPFRRTPANILMRGLEYSPIGLAKTISLDSYNLAKGKITASEYIDNVSEGLTGTALYGLGVFLAAQGILSVGGTGDDKEDKLAETEGYQKFALNIGGKSYTIDWLAPAAMPLFMGAALHNLKTDESKDGIKLDDILKIASDVSGPLLETSMLSSLNDFIEGFAAAKQQDQNLIYYGIMQSALSYIGQAVPTIGGRIARTIDPTRRTSFVDPQSGIPSDLQYFAQSVIGKVPFAASTKQPYIDQWGRTQESNSLAGRLAQNFLSPGYLKDVNVSAMETEIERLYENYGKENEVNVLPPVSVRKYFSNNGGSIYMTADEYTQYKKTSGQTAYSELTKLTSSAEYKSMTDAEKAKAVSNVYSESAEKAKTEIMEARGEMRLPSSADGEKIQTYIDAGISQKQAYDFYKSTADIDSDDKYSMVKAISGKGYTDKQAIALVGTLYTSTDKTSMLPYLTTSKHLLSLYLTNKDSEMISMSVPSTVTKDKVDYELTDVEKEAFRNVYANYFNSRVTNISTAAQVKSLRDKAYEAAKLAVIQNR